MAAGVKEGVHLYEKSFSAPSTPGRTFLSDGRPTTADTTKRDIPMVQEKRVPNYLKPTASSCHDTACRYHKGQQQHSEDPVTAATTRKCLISTKSMEEPASPSSFCNKTSKEKTPRGSLSPLYPRIVPEKASKIHTSGKTFKRAKSLPKCTQKRGEFNGTTAIKLEQQVKVRSIDGRVQCGAARHGPWSPKSNSEGKQWSTSEESDAVKPGAPRVKVTKKVSAHGMPRKLKFQQGRDQEGEGKEVGGERLKSKQRGERVKVEGEGKTKQENLVPAYNDVIEQTATKLAMRRSKVKALVGAFESVISLQEPESQPSKPQEVVVKVRRASQTSQPKPEKKVKVGEEGGHLGQESQQEETKGEEKNGTEEETKDGPSGPESRQKRTEEEESNGEEGDGVAEEDVAAKCQKS